jgi:hypothetical protein
MSFTSDNPSPQLRSGKFLCARFLAPLLLVFAFSSEAHSQTVSEYQLKAAYLYNFAKFVEWPADAFAGPNAPLRICVLGQDPFAGDLEQITAGKTVNGRTIQVDHVPEVSQARTCHIVFISSAKNDEIRRTLEGLRGASVLTVGDAKDFVALGGIINLVLEDSRIRFEVNLKAAERERLKISAKLLSLARLVQV